ncbi:sensor histidine kinase [Celeribacter sp.]|uniref:sensor histidine kinase n=1 Tax=Celeribacter sp. TaxID=1890673 RepID=UPI003A8F1F29
MRERSVIEMTQAQLVTQMAAALPFPVIIVGRDERIMATNAQAEAMFGKGNEGRHYITVLRQPMLLDAIESVLRLSEPARAEYRVTEAGRDLHYNVHANPVITDDFACVTVAFEDRTEVDEAGQMRRDFVANVSHELRTPLTAVLGFIETLQGPAANDAGARTRFLEIMGKEARRMNRIVGDLLSLSRVQADRRVRPTEEIDISAILRSVALSLAPLAQKQDVTLTLEGAQDATMIAGDHDQLTQVFTNLIENAIKYGGTDREVLVQVTAHAQEPTLRGPALRVDVLDQGEGIDPVHIPRLTERFYRVDSHRSRELGGTGLGLAIVKHILNRHRGRLKIESHKGQGTCFSVILPYE